MPDPFPLGGGLLTVFPPPAENPLFEDGNWAQLSPGQPPLRKETTSPTTGHAVHSNSNGQVNYSYWTTPIQGNPCEVWACTDGGQLGAALETWRVALWSQVGSNFSGYLAYYGGALSKDFAIRRYDNGSVAFTTGVGGGYPEKLGLRWYIGGLLELWAMFSGVWGLQHSTTDGTYSAPFYMGIGIEDPTSGTFAPSLAISCFGGGIKNRTQIYRWIKASKGTVPVP